MNTYERPITLAILAMGGQGGGVLADWVVSMAEAQGWVAQSTSVPGVAQRTGATIYYVEMLKPSDGRSPVLSLMPTPGDVDIVLAAEFMEAGRSMLRGLVTPDRTTLIASTHRSYAVGEKEVPGDGIGDPLVVVAAAGIAAKHTIAFDMQTLAEKNGSVISSALFGALAGAAVLPFERSAFEDAVRSGGKGVDASLRAFGAAFERARSGATEPVVRRVESKMEMPPRSVGQQQLDALLERLHANLPENLRPMAYAGLSKVVDWQDARYGNEYLDRLEALHALDVEAGGAAHGFAFTDTASKYLANAMAYDDVVRVADLKTRASRFDRVRREVGAREEQLVYTTEYMHPRMEEVVGSMPKSMGNWLIANRRLYDGMGRFVNKGRRVRTGTVFWFMALYMVSALKPMRRGMLRHSIEMEHVAHWLDVAKGQLPSNYPLAVQALATRRLVKGYSDTHSRGEAKFDRVLSAVPMLAGRTDGGEWLARLVLAALADEAGKALEGALSTVRSLSD
ncbi:indolepyruvate oxidoreductase subunit beta family protein [Devosia psychrophila]|uniref:Indolepyruvate ferredoxin oxidoreductase beta subunit n=1 Tax=Devosia psychrophila TaxID=728005 RepID=A0A0F5PV70_9HYPH|nr:indolepyruvate oxidoreductase subunit beta family protein [Devosia psychrophila]KKC32523.1 indolepyruvate oxidoreductase subunit B [Devosia psychrophila]SFD26425.1 indolepyruvate ferredoxin oxidoreductase beta subunit [Devosia psychrophila]